MLFFFLFTFVADTLTTIFSVLLPIFASYKALQSREPAALGKWLTYWTTLSLVLLAESLFYSILSWVPFYPWIRFLGHLYLVAPGKQGAMMVYNEYIGPFIYEHEQTLEGVVDTVWERAMGVAADYLKKA